MQQSLRRKLVGTKLVATVWADNTFFGDGKQEQTYMQMGVYHEGDRRCDQRFASLDSDKNTGKVALTISKKQLDRFGIKLVIED